MDDGTPVIVDTNILFSTLLGGTGRIFRTFFTAPHRFIVCETALVELFQHKEKILKVARITPDEVVGIYLSYVEAT